MAFALTKISAYGIEAEEALNKKYRQFVILSITASAADVALDLGDVTAGSLGTFWTAVSGTEPGATALTAMRDIQTRALTYCGAAGTSIAGYVQGTSVGAGVYTVTMDATATQLPNIAFNAGNGPTSYNLVLTWMLKDNEEPVAVEKTA